MLRHQQLPFQSGAASPREQHSSESAGKREVLLFFSFSFVPFPLVTLMTLWGLVTYDHSKPLIPFSFPVKKLFYQRDREGSHRPLVLRLTCHGQSCKSLYSYFNLEFELHRLSLFL